MNLLKGEGRFIAKYNEGLSAFAHLSQTVGARTDYVQGGGGNTSVKLDEQYMAIKASGFKLSDITTEKAYAVMNLKALQDFYLRHEAQDFDDVEAAGAALAKESTLEIAGLATLRPSVEAGFHAILDRYVAHSHSVYANLVACTSESERLMSEIMDETEYAWVLVPYTDPGARLAFAIKNAREAVKKQRGTYPQVILMQNHGLVVTSDSADECLAIHDEVNRLMAAYFDMGPTAFPQVQLRIGDDGTLYSATPYLQKKLSEGHYDATFFENTLLYPDQQVFLSDALAFTAEPLAGKANISADGEIAYLLAPAKAQVIEETLTAVVFIVETLREKGLALSIMGQEARHFIGNWESEKYRHSLLEKEN